MGLHNSSHPQHQLEGSSLSHFGVFRVEFGWSWQRGHCGAQQTGNGLRNSSHIHNEFLRGLHSSSCLYHGLQVYYERQDIQSHEVRNEIRIEKVGGARVGVGVMWDEKRLDVVWWDVW